MSRLCPRRVHWGDGVFEPVPASTVCAVRVVEASELIAADLFKAARPVRRVSVGVAGQRPAGLCHRQRMAARAAPDTVTRTALSAITVGESSTTPVPQSNWCEAAGQAGPVRRCENPRRRHTAPPESSVQVAAHHTHRNRTLVPNRPSQQARICSC